MAGASDIRDIMELSAPSDAPKPAKRPLPAAPAQPRLAGMAREVYALMGDRAPPIPIGDSMTKYKSKPKYQQRDWKPRKWEQRAFVNGARKDGLVLRHWKLANPVANGEVVPLSGGPETLGSGLEGATGGDAATGMVVKTTEDGQHVTTRFSDEFPMEKFNVKVQIPTYSEEQYDSHLKSDTWTKQETDHLVELCRDYDLRWFVITDRWNFDPEEGQEEDFKQANGDAMEVDGEAPSVKPRKSKWPPPRTMEQLKQRYYVVSAAMLAISRPPNDMLPSEYALWEKMQKFDAATETQRKKLAEALFSRSEDEAMEEKLLLAELKKIVDHEDQFLAERKDVYARLEAVPSTRREADVNFQSSAALSALLQNLLAKEKRGKIIRAPDATVSSGVPPAPAQPERTQSWEKGSHPNQYTRRNTNTEDGDHAPPPKKGQSAINVRKLSPAEEAKFGVSHHDRLTSGVGFRHERVQKMTQAKSQAQTLKLQSALTELEIPPRLVMPTEKVCREFERLISQVNLLLDVRKLAEKVKSEAQVLEEARRLRLGLPKETDKAGNTMDVDEKAESEQSKAKDSADPESLGTQPATNGEIQEENKTDVTNQPAQPAETTDKDDAEDEEDEENEESKVELDNEDEEDKDEDDEPEVEASDADADADADAAEDDEEDHEEEDQQDQEDEDMEDEEEDTGLNLNLDEEDEEEEDQDGEADGDVEEEVESEAAEDEPDAEDEEAEGDDDDDDDDDDEDEDDANADAEADADSDGDEEQGDGEDEEAEEGGQDSPQVDGDEEEEEEADGDDTGLSAPPSAATRLHKRSASVISEGSRTGSNRSGGGRKRRK